jgi:dTDP-4-amino-4,6-dideoxygalactose transaminase
MKAPFTEPILVTRPLLPDLELVNKRMKDIWASQWLTNGGAQLAELENQLKKYLQVQNLVLFNNGTLALMLGLKALELSGEVITTPFTFPATVQALDWTGLAPVFCDVDPKTLNIDPEKIEALITDQTSAILAVHVFGTPCEVRAIENIARKHNLKVIYDGAHAFGSKVNDFPVSAYGDMTMFSFHATKLFNTVEGGALAVQNSALAENLNLWKNFGLHSSGEVVFSGTNAKMNEVQACIGLEVLQIIGEERGKRKKIKETYIKNLAGIPGIEIVNNDLSEDNSFQYFVIKIDEKAFGKSRDWVHEELKKYNVFARKYFYPLCSNFQWYQGLSSALPANLPVANKIISQTLAMPFYGKMGEESAAAICDILRDMQQGK